MKAKHALIILALGYGIEFTGSVRKVRHAADADILLYAGVWFKVVGGAAV